MTRRKLFIVNFLDTLSSSTHKDCVTWGREENARTVVDWRNETDYEEFFFKSITLPKPLFFIIELNEVNLYMLDANFGMIFNEILLDF